MSASSNAGQILPPDRIGEELGRWLRSPDEKDRVFPKNKKIEVVFLVEAVNAILPRTEGVEDITLIKLPGTDYEVPVILPEKLQAVARRRMLAQLRSFRDQEPEKLKKHLETLANLYQYRKGRGSQSKTTVGFVKAKEWRDKPEEWNCYIQPPGGDIREATDVGMDGFCPACMLFGTVISGDKIEGIGNESIGVKSRVEFDPAIAFTDKERSVMCLTHNKVSDGVSWTGRGLYTECHVVPGTVFIGKATLEDVTETELKAFLAILASIDRLGGRERVFGGVRVHLLGIRGGSYETVSALEIATELAKKYNEREQPPSIDEVRNDAWRAITGKGFARLETAEYQKLLDDMNIWDKLWSDTVNYDKQVVERVLQLIRGKGKYEEAGGAS